MSSRSDSRRPRPQPETADVVVRSLSINRASPVPLWYQLAQGLQGLIESSVLAPGGHLNNELLLSKQLNLSRPTVRRALEYLVDQGLIVRRRGVGTRVVNQKVRRPLALTSLYDDLRAGGQQPTTRLLAHDVQRADAEVAAALEVAEGDEVTRIERLRSVDDQPIARMTNYLPTWLAELTVEALESGGLYELIRTQGIVLHAATQIIGAKRATASEAAVLAEDRGAALLTMQRTAYDDHGRPVEFGRHLYAASRYFFQTQLVSPG